MSANSKLSDLYTAHTVDLDRVGVSLRAKVLGVLKTLEADLIAQLASAELTVRKRAKLQTLLAQTQRTIKDGYSKVLQGQFTDLTKLAELEEQAASAFLNRSIGVSLTSVAVTRAQLQRLVDGTLINGAPSKEWWAKQAGALNTKFSDQVTQGYLRGENTDEIVRRIRGTAKNNFKDGIMEVARRDATALVRSSVMAVANAARLDMYESNQDLVKAVQWQSTLDSRTSDICKARSGLLYTVAGKPLGHNIVKVGPPAHFNCRSTLVPVLKSWDELAGPNAKPRKQDPSFDSVLFKQNLLKKGMTEEQAGAALSRMQSSMDGVVSDKLDYEDWLKTKDEAFQREVLGDGKWELWKAGKITLTDLIDNSGRPLTIDELRDKIGLGQAGKVVDNRAALLVKQAEDAAQKITTYKGLYPSLTLPENWEANPLGALPLVEQEVKGIVEGYSWDSAPQKVKLAVGNYIKAMAQGKAPTPLQTEAFGQLNSAAKEFVEAQIQAKAAGSPTALANLKNEVKILLINGDDPEAMLAPVMKLLTAKEKAAYINTIVDEMIADGSLTPALQAAKLKGYGKQIQTRLKEAAAAKKPAPVGTASPVEEIVAFEQIGGQGGSNAGALFRDTKTGKKWYIKRPATDAMAQNEVLASKLYQLGGVEVPHTQTIFLPDTFLGANSYGYGVASRIIDGLASDPAALRAGKVAGVGEGLAFDAWLANWDVVGATFDNMLVTGGRAVRLDTGGALLFRAQGGLKGSAFGPVVTEFDTLLDPALNPQAAAVFRNVTKAQLEAGVRRLLAIPDATIRATVKEWGPPEFADDLAATLIARKADIARRFPHLVPEEPPAFSLPTAATEGLSPGEVAAIRDARLNGYTRLTDKDAVEDHNLLMWQERAADDSILSMAQFKIVGEAQERLFNQIKNATSEVADRADVQHARLVVDEFNRQMMDTLRGLGSQMAKRETLRGKDVERIRNLLAQFETAKDELEAAYALGKLDDGVLSQFRSAADPWMAYIRKLSSAKVGDAIPPTGVTGLFQGIEVVGKKLDQPVREGLNWVRADDGFLEKVIARGYAKRTGKTNSLFKSQSKHMKAELPDGTVIRVWNNDDQWALYGRVEIEVKGDNPGAVLRALDALGIDSKATDATERELVYLKQMAYLLGDSAHQRVSKVTSVEAARKALSEELGFDVTTSPAYRPDGVPQAFGHGRRVFYRFDLDANPEWAQFREQYRLRHTLTGNTVEIIEKILEGGGVAAATTERLRRGVLALGMSSHSDIATGGASYFFTRILRAPSRPTRGLWWKADALKRLDAISYNRDLYGNVKGNTVRENRQRTIAEFKDAARSESNETIFKGGLSLFDDLDMIVVVSTTEQDKLIALFRRHGYVTWPDGRALADVIKVEE